MLMGGGDFRDGQPGGTCPGGRLSGGALVRGANVLPSLDPDGIRIVTKIYPLGSWAMPYTSKKFRQNPFTTFSVIRRTDKQTEVNKT